MRYVKLSIVDLHTHSNKSDGEYAPSEVVRLAFEAGVSVMALTDHDTTDGLKEAIGAAAEICAAGGASKLFTFIPGMELTTADEHEQHILGYFIDPDDSAMREYTERLMLMRRERAGNVLLYLKGRGVIFSKARVRSLTRLPYIGRPHIAKAMIESGYADSLKDAFNRYLTGPEFKKVPRPKPTAKDAISAIKSAGGVAVLAHPHSLKLDRCGMLERLKYLKSIGLSGMECHYGAYGEKQTAAFRDMAEILGLVVTGGSDFHGEGVKPGILLGTGREGMLHFDDAGIADKLRSYIV
jgi:predicted metal-dependent phosphoesterase TrpH